MTPGDSFYLYSIGTVSSAGLERTPDKREVDGSSPFRPTICLYGGIAQLGEHLPCKQGVESSNLLVSIAVKRLQRTVP